MPAIDAGRPEPWAQVWLIEFDGEWDEHAPARRNYESHGFQRLTGFHYMVQKFQQPAT